jgi:glycosyltransferase involved in cell wall biosynthesis
VFVAPLRFGAGMKGKVGEAMAAGLPVATSPIGAEGMDLVSGHHVLIASDLDAEVDAICSLVRDDGLWTRISEEARIHVRKRFSPEAIRPTLEEIVRALGAHDGAT